MEEIKSEKMDEKVVSEQQIQTTDDISSLQQQIEMMQKQLQQKIEQKKVTLNTKLSELIAKKVELTTQLANIQQKISEIKKELGIEEETVKEETVKKTRKAKTTDGNTVKQYYSINGQGKYTASQIAKQYGFFKAYFVYNSDGTVSKKLFANWDRFLPLILKGKTGQGYGEMDNGQDRISSTICDKVRQEVKPIVDNTVTTDNANTNTQQNANSDNTNANKELLDQLPKNPITDNANSNTQNNATDNATTDNNTTQQ